MDFLYRFVFCAFLLSNFKANKIIQCILVPYNQSRNLSNNFNRSMYDNEHLLRNENNLKFMETGNNIQLRKTPDRLTDEEVNIFLTKFFSF